MGKHNQIHTLSAPHCKAHFRFLRELNECAFKKKHKGLTLGKTKKAAVHFQKFVRCIVKAGDTIKRTRRLPGALSQRGRQKGPKIELCSGSDEHAPCKIE